MCLRNPSQTPGLHKIHDIMEAEVVKRFIIKHTVIKAFVFERDVVGSKEVDGGAWVHIPERDER